MAITVRNGYESQFDINKMLPGEFAVTTDTNKVYICTAPGISKELASVEELQNILGVSDEAFEAFQELINAMEDGAVVTGLLNDVSNLKSGNYTISFSEAEERTNIESTDTVKTVFGKIRKFFSDLSSVAFTGNYKDLAELPNLSNAALSGSYNDLTDKPTLGDAASKNVANNDTTTEEGYVADARVVKNHKEKIDLLEGKAAELTNKLPNILNNYVLPLKSDLNDVSELTANRSISFAYYVVNAKNSPNSNSYGIVMSYHTSGTSYNQTAFDMNAGAIYVRKLDGAWKQI